MTDIGYRVVINRDGQFSIWPQDRPLPSGWQDAGVSGTREACLAHIEVVWTDLRPLSVRDRKSVAAAEAAATLPWLVARQAERSPHDVAVQFGDDELTFAALDAQAARVARALRRRGIGPEDLVGICAHRSSALVVGLLGILKAGGGFVPLDPEYPDARLAFMARDANLAATLAPGELAERAGRVVGGDVLRLDDLTTGPVVPEPEVGPLAGPDNVAYAMYTSGSTGQPKGVPNTHRGIVNRLDWAQRTYPLGRDDAVLQKTPVSFDVSIWELFWPLISGARLVLAEPGRHRDPRYLCQVMAARAVTTVHFVTSLLSVFLQEPGVEKLRRLRRVICSGEELPVIVAREFAERLPWCELYNLYGPTEAAIEVSAWACRSEALAHRSTIPIGSPIQNVDLYVLDPAGDPVRTGVPGELYIGGAGVARGYLGRPGTTAERFVPDPFRAAGARLYRTGDRVRWNGEGVLEFLGRFDHQVKLRGQRIELGEIESVLRSLPQVRDAVVTVREDVPGDQRLVAYLIPERGGEIDVTVVRSALEQVLPAAMVPAAYVRMAAFPLLHNGKLDRASLPRPARRGRS